jgi:hypothetical protein
MPLTHGPRTTADPAPNVRGDRGDMSRLDLHDVILSEPTIAHDEEAAGEPGNSIAGGPRKFGAAPVRTSTKTSQW